ncbi:urease accessory protein [Jejubacter calystegiae]|uniref:Urease accessory protein UreD n=1 Tax=Jejubacter calystegiae TaxID=2579935 RepID=A0A4P8YQB9_9ENTR|nr:urease accessory protein UreD [Jejubacter calystegiae]QCT22316.1 urease accessory protein [Jejubacter calystegiae]
MTIAQAFDAIAQLGQRAPELAMYQDEPPQMASGSAGKNGYLHLSFAQRGERSVLADMDRRAPSLVQRALYWDESMPQMPCVFMISTSGCVLQGDRLMLDIHMAPGACAHVTTQSATKIHAMTHNYAIQRQQIVLQEESYLELMPDPTIPHSGSRFLSDTHITQHPTATLLYSEILASGRKHHPADRGFRFTLWSSHICASRPSGEEIFSERYVLRPDSQPLNGCGVMGPFNVFGNVILLTPVRYHACILARTRPRYHPDAGIACGASLLPNEGGLIFKVLGMEPRHVKSAIREFWQIVREEIIGVGLSAPFLWR